ncbi:MAG: hypothetical protein VX346_19570 [Planctomycetota bacterium]|nr:hypothetical protein [Planctomycetota bacterium]
MGNEMVMGKPFVTRRPIQIAFVLVLLLGATSGQTATTQATRDSANDLVLGADNEHKRLIRIARLPIQFRQAFYEQDAEKRQALLQMFLDNSGALSAESLIGEVRTFEMWVDQVGL